MKETNEMGIIRLGEPAYPALLEEIKNPPKQLFYVGNPEILQRRCVAVVGSRTTTAYGRNMSTAIGMRLARQGITVVSGMALGIDSCAHEGALSAAGCTAAVLGCGVDICYPRENGALKKEIERTGIVLSEYEPGTPAERYNFPNRNRIISGLCEMTIVVQARNRSGALITAELAMEQGREVMALPGNIDSQYNLGNNKLISEGATPVISLDDIFEPLGLRQLNESRAMEELSDTEYALFSLLKERGEMTIDEICLHMCQKPAYVNPILSVMEMKGFVFSDLGKFFLANT
ncbi:MAG: DNA-processing protein DprA [Lentihominibacter sp.]